MYYLILTQAIFCNLCCVMIRLLLAIKLQKTMSENLHIYENFFPRIVHLI